MGSGDSEVELEAAARSGGIRRRARWRGMGLPAVEVGRRGSGEWGEVPGGRGEREGEGERE